MKTAYLHMPPPVFKVGLLTAGFVLMNGAWLSFNTHLIHAQNSQDKTLSSIYSAKVTGSNKILKRSEKLSRAGQFIVQNNDIIYYALENDTLSSISEKFTGEKKHWPELSRLNKIDNDRRLPIGSSILIPNSILKERPSQAKVIALAGEVQEQDAKGDKKILAIGHIVYEGSQLSTSPNGFISLSLPDESRITIPSNSQVNFTKLRMTEYASSPRTTITLLQGKIESKVTPLTQNKGRYEVRSPLAVAAVRGTHFRVGVLDKEIGNEVLEGGVGVGIHQPSSKHEKNTHKKNTSENTSLETLPAGKGNLVSTQGISKPIDLLAAPSLQGDYALQERPVVQFSAKAQDHALRFHAQITKDAKAEFVLQEATETQTFKLSHLEDGDYFIRLTAIDKNQLEGNPSIFPFKLKARPEPPFIIQPKKKIRSDNLEFSWGKVEDVQNYHLQIATDAQFKHIVVDQAQLDTPIYPHHDLPKGEYFWRVASIMVKNNGPDHGPFSTPESFQYLAPQSVNPPNDSGGDDIELSWTAEPKQIFKVQIAKDKNFKSIILNQDTNEPSIKIPRLEAGKYWIRVQSTDADGYVAPFSKPQEFEIIPRLMTHHGSLKTQYGPVKTTSFE